MTDAVVRLLDEAIRERDELREQVAQMERAIQMGEGHFLTLQREKRLEDELHRLRAALEKYGAHDYDCDKISLEGGIRSGDWPCTCGLDAALTPPAADPPPASVDNPPRAPSG